MIIDLLPMLGIRYARVVPTTGGFGMTESFYAWAGTCHHNQNLLERGESLFGTSQDAVPLSHVCMGAQL